MNSQHDQTTASAQLQSELLDIQWDGQQILEINSLSPGKVQVLNRSVSVLVPTTIDATIPADTRLYAEQTKQFMAERFGGAIAIEQEGLYISPQWGMIRETTIAVRSYTTTASLKQHFPMLLGFVRYLQQELRQETMGVEMDGKLLLIQFE